MKCDTNKKYKQKRRKRLLISLAVIFAIVFGIIMYFNFYVNPIILASNKGVIKSKTISVINSSVQSVISTNAYDDLIKVSYDLDGNITSITANSMLANQLNTQVLEKCQDGLNDITSLCFNVPLGSFSGIPLLNGIGPNINIKMIPIGSVQTYFKSEFVSAGINQTYHKIFLDVSAEMSILLPGTNQSVVVNTQILVGESVIVGKVPQVYFGNSSLLNSQLNLIP